MQHIVIIGNGISGITAARHIRKRSAHRITIISSETDHFFSRTALMYIYMGHLTYKQTKPYEDHFWSKNRLELKRAFVERVDIGKKQLHLKGGESFAYDQLILATGSKPRWFGWPGQELDGVQGFYSYQDLELLEKNAADNKKCRRAVIVGGGLIGIEVAEMLYSRNIPVTFLVRESSFWNNVLPDQDSQLINTEIQRHHIDLRLGQNLQEILADDHGCVRAVVVGESGEEVPCDLVCLTTGVTPNIDFLKNSGIETNRGVLVNRTLETNIPGIYAIGDCAEHRDPWANRQAVEAVWYTGRMMGEAVARTITGDATAYNPGPWFNSAKFFTIEYQTYGWVSGETSGVAHEEQFHWEHPNGRMALTFAYNRENNLFLGINSFGLRLRHEVFDRWLRNKTTIDHVIDHLAEANFDPEFYKHFESEVIRVFRQTINPTSDERYSA